MKKFLIFIVILLLKINIAKAEDLLISPLNLNFWGTVASGNNIIIYSDSSYYLLSSDEGISWFKYQLPFGAKITELKTYNDTIGEFAQTE